jgi:hypothetical protein
MTKIMEVVITPDGQARIETKGFHGPACQQASQFLEQSLGQRTLSQPTAEYFETEPSRLAQNQEL